MDKSTPFSLDLSGNFVCKLGKNRINTYPCKCEFGYHSILNSFDC